MKKILFLLLVLTVITINVNSENTFIGSEQCGECHEDIYTRYLKNSPKHKSFDSIKKMENKLSKEEFKSCFKCHTMGYGTKSGFESEKVTPDLKNVGCESCHGRGSKHAETESKADINRLPTIDICLQCHKEGYSKKLNVISGAH